MSKLDTLANKIAEKLLPKVRVIVREEIEYALSHSNKKQIITDKSEDTKGTPDNPNLNEVVSQMKQEFESINSNSMVNPNETFEDENGKIHKMGDLIKNENAQKVINNVNKDYSALID